MRRTVDVESLPVTVSPDDLIDDRDRWQALVHGRAIDELTGRPVEVTCSSVRSTCTTGSGGLFGLTGRPRTAGVGSPWTLNIEATGFAPATITGLFTGVMLPLGDVELRRSPVVLLGSTVARPKNNALNHVTIELSGIKRSESSPQSPPDIVALDLPLAVGRSLATTVEVVTLADRLLAPSEPPLRLRGAAERGATAIDLVDASAITVNQILRLGDLDLEYVSVARVDPLRPRLDLSTPLARRHPASAEVAEQTVAVDATTPLLATGEVGDAVLFVDHSVFATRHTVRVRTPGLPDEIRIVLPFASTTAADGLWAFPPISRVTEVALRVTHPTRALFPAVATNPTVRLNLGVREQRRDFVLN